MAETDETKLNELIGKMLGDLGGAFSVPTVRLGFRLWSFRRSSRRWTRNIR